MKKKLLICGATGFIGRNLAEYFARTGEYELYGTYYMSKPYQIDGMKFIKADLREADQADKVIAGMDIVIQAAATTSGAKDILSKPYIHVTDNAVMNSIIFRSAFENKIERLVFFSCGVMYQPSEMPLKESDYSESDLLVPAYFGVGWTKVYIEKMCEFYSRISNTKFTVLRQSNIYGPYDKFDLEHSHVFGATVTKVMTAPEDGQIVVWGNGKTGRDLLYVDDVVRFVDLAIHKQEDPYMLYNVGLGKVTTVNELVEMIIKASGKHLTIKNDLSKPSIQTSLFFDTGRAREKLSWQPQYTLEQGIEKTLYWYRNEYKQQ